MNESEVVNEHRIFDNSPYFIVGKLIQFVIFTIILILSCYLIHFSSYNGFLGVLGGGAWFSMGGLAWKSRWEHLDIIIQIIFISLYMFGFIIWMGYLIPAVFMNNSLLLLLIVYLSISEIELWMGFGFRNRLRRIGLTMVINTNVIPEERRFLLEIFQKFKEEFGGVQSYLENIDSDGVTQLYGFNWRTMDLKIFFKSLDNPIAEIICVTGNPRIRKRLTFVAKSIVKHNPIQSFRDYLLGVSSSDKIQTLDETVNYLTLAPLITSIAVLVFIEISGVLRIFTTIIILSLWGGYKAAKIQNAIDLRLGLIMTLYALLLYTVLNIPLLILIYLFQTNIGIIFQIPDVANYDSFAQILSLLLMLTNGIGFSLWKYPFRSIGIKSWNFIQSQEVQYDIDKEIVEKGRIESRGRAGEYEIFQLKRLESLQTAHEEAAILQFNSSKQLFLLLLLALLSLMLAVSPFSDIILEIRWLIVPLPLLSWIPWFIGSKWSQNTKNKAETSLNIIKSFLENTEGEN